MSSSKISVIQSKFKDIQALQQQVTFNKANVGQTATAKQLLGKIQGQARQLSISLNSLYRPYFTSALHRALLSFFQVQCQLLEFVFGLPDYKEQVFILYEACALTRSISSSALIHFDRSELLQKWCRIIQRFEVFERNCGRFDAPQIISKLEEWVSGFNKLNLNTLEIENLELLLERTKADLSKVLLAPESDMQEVQEFNFRIQKIQRAIDLKNQIVLVKNMLCPELSFYLVDEPDISDFPEYNQQLADDIQQTLQKLEDVEDTYDFNDITLNSLHPPEQMYSNVLTPQLFKPAEANVLLSTIQLQHDVFSQQIHNLNQQSYQHKLRLLNINASLQSVNQISKNQFENDLFKVDCQFPMSNIINQFLKLLFEDYNGTLKYFEMETAFKNLMKNGAVRDLWTIVALREYKIDENVL
ncbi:Hypothetical_protein [Hexamita inflata]|uniref:Hypothetical_protein n=1 Tax=Hexamita inflata TaxID=28002 RepID=A0AA86PCS2_9EUKA|nr:Hypothetical protein HINF_LOCUS24066 [Hexamita inflata]